MRLGLALLVLLTWLAAPAGAATATVTSRTSGLDRVVAIELVAGPGERNDVEVEITDSTVTFRDRGADPSAGTGCNAAFAVARCAIPATTAAEPVRLVVAVRGGDGDDRVHIATPTAMPAARPLVVGATGDDGADDLAVDSVPVEGSFNGTPAFLGLLEGGAGDDRLAGGDGSDLLAGGPGRDRLRGGPGGDSLNGDGGGSLEYLSRGTLPPPAEEMPADDVLDGGPGQDAAGYSTRSTPVTIDLADPAADGSAGESDVLSGIEDVGGGAGADDLRGDDGANRLDGGAGADRLTGRGGSDVLSGSGGSNLLDGGEGDDLLSYPAPGSRCGGGTDRVEAPAVTLDGELWRDCELMPFGLFGTSALRLRPVRLRGGSLVLQGLAFDGPSPRQPGGRNDVKIEIRRPGGRVIAAGHAKVPEGTPEGRRFTMRVKLTRRGRRMLRRLPSVRVTLIVESSRPSIDLPRR
jgi:hypothetical protein